MLTKLITEIRNCQLCKPDLPHGPRPVIQLAKEARLLIIGQAPGVRVHETGIPWNDKSGDRLRSWLQLDKSVFYDPNKVAIVPMGFCYPGKGRSGDLPPRPECAPTWHSSILNQLPQIELILLIGSYSQSYYLEGSSFLKSHKTLTARVKNYEDCPEPYFLLPHPSPRNQIWLSNNRWFESTILPRLRVRIERLSLNG